MLPRIEWPRPTWAAKAWLFGCLGLAIIICIALLQRYQLYSSRLGVWTAVPGTIVSTDCRNHATVTYEYVVGDKTYRTTGASSGAGIYCDRARTGDPIRIYVDPTAPARSMVGAPEGRLRDYPTILIGMPGLVIGAGVLGYALFRVRRSAQPTDT